MALRSYQLALTAAAKRLSDVYGGPPGVADPKTDIVYRQITLQAEAGAVYIGADGTVISTLYGAKIDNTNTGPGLTIGHFDSGPLHLSDIYAAGAGATIHIIGIPF